MAIYRDLALTTRHSIQIMVFLFYESSFLGYDPPEQAVFSNCNLCQEVVYMWISLVLTFSYTPSHFDKFCTYISFAMCFWLNIVGKYYLAMNSVLYNCWKLLDCYHLNVIRFISHNGFDLYHVLKGKYNINAPLETKDKMQP